MFVEGMSGLHSGVEGGRRSPELAAALEDPRQVFDSDLPTADDQSKKVVDELSKLDGVYSIGSTTIYIDHSLDDSFSITIEWSEAQMPSVLKLTPLPTGGFSGAWGYSQESEKLIPLSKIWGSPEGTDLVIKPTIDRWTVRTQSEHNSDLNMQAHDVYVGLGFLLLGQPWMHIGNHEVAGHLPDIHDENEAWTRAHQWTKKIHLKTRAKIIKGVFKGFFNSLAKPSWFRNISSEPTIGEVAMYGLVSHAGNDNARIPRHWQSHKEQIQENFNQIIQRVHGLYDDLIRQQK